MRTAIVVAVVVVAIAAAVFLFFPIYKPAPVRTGAQPQQTAPGSSLTQRDAGEGAVEIDVTLVVPGSPDAAKYKADAQTVFLVSMNTHSVDLARYDLVKISDLLAGRSILRPLRWVSTSDNNHHRSGALVFPQTEKAARSTALELRIRTIAGVPVRTFRWTP